jgi:hypothetical protein
LRHPMLVLPEADRVVDECEACVLSGHQEDERPAPWIEPVGPATECGQASVFCIRYLMMPSG